MSEEENIFDVIPIQIGEMYPKKEEIWHFINDTECSDTRMIEDIKMNFERVTKIEHGIIVKNGMVVAMF